MRDFFRKLDVNGDQVGTGLDKGFKKDFRLAAHEVDVEEQIFGVGPDGGDDGRTEGNVRHELTVHDVKVQPVGPGSGGARGFLAEAGKIRSEQ